MLPRRVELLHLAPAAVCALELLEHLGLLRVLAALPQLQLLLGLRVLARPELRFALEVLLNLHVQDVLDLRVHLPAGLVLGIFSPLHLVDPLPPLAQVLTLLHLCNHLAVRLSHELFLSRGRDERQQGLRIERSRVVARVAPLLRVALVHELAALRLAGVAKLHGPLPQRVLAVHSRLGRRADRLLPLRHLAVQQRCELPPPLHQRILLRCAQLPDAGLLALREQLLVRLVLPRCAQDGVRVELEASDVGLALVRDASPRCHLVHGPHWPSGRHCGRGQLSP
mmetsp:Transcript_28934/g.67281  ORF Transcript_28934/g.67281 Transcript_28934/m.67281 type:complete len:282 (-) Transcript_28934:2-847(-)